MKEKLLIISFDAVGSDELSQLRELPNFKRIFAGGTIFPDLRTVFISNTYPVHASIATGTCPGEHGILSNVMFQPEMANPWWNYDSRKLKREPIWTKAAKKGLSTAAVMWPVTAYARDIRWNIPEIKTRDGESQIIANLRCGSKIIQILTYLRHHKLLRGIEQPERDRFAAACMRDIIDWGHPNLMLMHLTAYDSLCHEHGRGSAECGKALREMDKNLGMLSDESGPDTTVIVFSDHAQLNVHTAYDPNRLLEKMGFLKYNENGTVENAKAFFHNGDGSSFLINRELSPEQIEAVKSAVLAEESVQRELRAAEMKESGFDSAAEFGISAAQGYYFRAANIEKATHGYPTDYPNYGVFFAINKPGWQIETNSILEVSKAAFKLLDEA